MEFVQRASVLTTAVMATLLLGALVTGCTAEKKPQRGPAQAKLGEFNLHKRHGLGDWSGKPLATEKEVLGSIRQAATASGKS